MILLERESRGNQEGIKRELRGNCNWHGDALDLMKWGFLLIEKWRFCDRSLSLPS